MAYRFHIPKSLAIKALIVAVIVLACGVTGAYALNYVSYENGFLTFWGDFKNENGFKFGGTAASLDVPAPGNTLIDGRNVYVGTILATCPDYSVGSQGNCATILGNVSSDTLIKTDTLSHPTALMLQSPMTGGRVQLGGPTVVIDGKLNIAARPNGTKGNLIAVSNPGNYTNFIATKNAAVIADTIDLVDTITGNLSNPGVIQNIAGNPLTLDGSVQVKNKFELLGSDANFKLAW